MPHKSIVEELAALQSECFIGLYVHTAEGTPEAGDIAKILAVKDGYAQILYLLDGRDDVKGLDVLTPLPPCFKPDPAVFPHT